VSVACCQEADHLQGAAGFVATLTVLGLSLASDAAQPADLSPFGSKCVVALLTDQMKKEASDNWKIALKSVFQAPHSCCPIGS
jgi:hypothetical protein